LSFTHVEVIAGIIIEG